MGKLRLRFKKPTNVSSKSLSHKQVRDMQFNLPASEKMIIADPGVRKRDALLQCAHLPIPRVIQIANRRNM